MDYHHDGIIQTHSLCIQIDNNSKNTGTLKIPASLQSMYLLIVVLWYLFVFGLFCTNRDVVTSSEVLI